MSQSKLLKAVAADRLGVSPKQLERYVSEGMPCSGTGRARRFPWPEIRHWRDERIRAEARAAAERTMGVTDAKARKLVAEARTAELEVGQLENTLIPLEVHEIRLEKLCERLAAAVKGLGRFAGDVQRAMTDLEAAELLDRMIDDTLRALMAVGDEVDDLVDADDEVADRVANGQLR